MSSSQACKFFALNGVCKFGEQCAYTHNESIAEEIKSIRLSIENICRRIDLYERRLLDLENVSSPKTDLEEQEEMSENFVIQQMDGCDDIEDITVTFQCEDCQETFTEEDVYINHMDSERYFCEECKICFLVQLEYDKHEYELHTAEYFRVSKLTPTRKHLAIERLNQEMGF